MNHRPLFRACCGILLALSVGIPVAGQEPRPAPVVTVAQPVEAASDAFDYPCRLDPAEVVEVRAPLGGVVAKVHASVGAEVKAGDVLIELAPRDLKKDLEFAEADVKRRETDLRKAESALAKTQKPAKKKADELDVAKARAERDLAAAFLKVAQAEVKQLRQDREAARVKAPISGRVMSLAAAGDRVEGGPRSATRLAVLARFDAVRASFALDEKTLLHVRALLRKGAAVKTPANVPALLRLPGEKAFGHKGALETVDNRVDPKSGRVRVNALFPNPDGSLTGAVLAEEKKRAEQKKGEIREEKTAKKKKQEEPPFIRVELGQPRKLLLVPGRSVGADDRGDHFVLVVDNKNVVAKRTVKLGPLLDGLQAIEEGLEPGVWVVVSVGGAKRDPADKNVSPEDFLQDARLMGLRPGTTVRPVRVTLARPAK